MATLELTSLRYETPTAVLAVTGRSLAISQWSTLPVIQPLRFQLTVTPGSRPLGISGNQTELIALQTALQDYSHGILTHHTRPVAVSGIELQPEGAAQHRLILGPLSSVPAITGLTLSDLELADWVDLFAQMGGQVRSLPVTLGNPRRRRQWRQWSSLAAVFVVAVGTVAVWPYLSQPGSYRSTSRPTPIGDATTESLEAPEILEEPSLASGTADATIAQSEDQEDANNAADRPGPSQGSSSAPSRPKTATSPEPASTPPPIAPSPPTATLELESEPERSSGSAAARTPQTEQAAGVDDADVARTAAPELEAAVPFADSLPSLPSSWQPPEAFTGTLVYQITLTPEGVITAIAPEDDRAATYQDQTGLPEIGTAITDDDLPETIRVTFYSDGTVEITTSLESP
jgi:hypothetical protein